MTTLSKGNVVSIEASRDVDLHAPKVVKALQTLYDCGLEPTHNGEVLDFLITFESLVAKHPVIGPDDFMGREHFRVYANETETEQRTMALLFANILNPTQPGRVESSIANQAVADYVELTDGGLVVVKERHRTGLGILPSWLRVNNSLEFNPNTHAITAGSIIELASRPDVMGNLQGVGKGQITALDKLSGHLGILMNG